MICAMLSTAWAEEIMAALLGIPKCVGDMNCQNEDLYLWGLIIFVNGCIWITNFSIQSVQMGLRSLIVDLIPTDQQALANAWAARFVMIGNVLGYCINMIDLPKYFNFLGRSQFQITCALVSINLATCISITCYWGQESSPKRLGFPEETLSTLNRIKATLRRLRMLSEVTRKVCVAQSCSWIGWFLFLFYTTT